MPYKRLRDGLYLIKQKSRIKPGLIDHYGVVDIGNVLNHPQGNPYMPIVIHQAIPRVRIDWLANTGKWQIIGKVKNDQIGKVKMRIRKAIINPGYNLLTNNCEHFANYVTTGKKESKQLQAAVGVGLTLTALNILVWNIK